MKGESGAAKAWAAAVQSSKWKPAGDNALYRRFTLGPVLGPSSMGGPGDADTWRGHVDAALEAAGGELPWQELRDVLVERRRMELARNGSQGGLNNAEQQALLPQLALAHIPEVYLSHTDSLVRLVKS